MVPPLKIHFSARYLSVQSSKSAPSIQEANINEGVAGLLTGVHKLEGDTIDVEEDHIGMEEDHVGTPSLIFAS
jgi:hypothetical protein